MGSKPVFSEEFYTRSLFQQGERAYLTEDGTVAVRPHEETRWGYLKRFMTFRQDPATAQVHDHLKALMEGIRKKSGEGYSALKREIYGAGSERFNCLDKNLGDLHAKLSHVGQLNLLSKAILKIVNLVRKLLCLSEIKVQRYINYDLDDYFALETHRFRNRFIQLTPEDKESCRFYAKSSRPDATDKVQKLEKGLRQDWWMGKSLIQVEEKHTLISSRLKMSFSPEDQQFYLSSRFDAALSLTRGKPKKEDIPENSHYRIRYKDSKEGSEKQEIERSSMQWSYDSTFNRKLFEKEGTCLIDANSVILQGYSSRVRLEPDVCYEIFKPSGELLLTFTLRKKA